MSAKGQEDPGEDLTSRVGAESPCSDMKRAAAKKLIERYFYQLTDGCGNPQCDNQHCASSGKVTNLTPNQAAGQAIQLFSQEARLCDGTQPNKVARTTLEPGPASLAKSLPVKSVNPTCSDEGIAPKSDKMNRGFEAVASNSASFPSGSLLGTVDNCETKETPYSSFKAPKNLQVTFKNVEFAPRTVSSTNENASVSKAGRLCTKSSNIDGISLPIAEKLVPKDSRPDQNSSNLISTQSNGGAVTKPRIIQSRGSRGSAVASSSNSSMKSIPNLRRANIPRGIYSKSVSPRRTRYRDRTRQSNARGSKGKCVDVIDRRSLRAKRNVNSRQVGNRQLQQLVRKLVVLTLYLRYLEVKRSSRCTKHNQF